MTHTAPTLVSWAENLTRSHMKQGTGSGGDLVNMFTTQGGQPWYAGDALLQRSDAQGWVAVDLGTTRHISQCVLNFANDQARQRAGNLTLAYSNHFHDWERLVEGPDAYATPFPLDQPDSHWQVFYKPTAIGHGGLTVAEEVSNTIPAHMFEGQLPIVGRYLILVFDWQQASPGEDNRAAKPPFAVHITDLMFLGEALLVLDPHAKTGVFSKAFLAQYPGNQRTAICAPRDAMHPSQKRLYTPFDVLDAAFGRNVPGSGSDAVEGATNGALAQFSGDPFNPETGAKRHLQSVWDETLQKYVMKVSLCGNTMVDGQVVSCPDSCYRHGPNNRQRVELKTNNHSLYGHINEISATRYLMKLPEGIHQQVHGFFHVFQYKAVLSTPKHVVVTTPSACGEDIPIGNSRDSEAGNPILTLTVTPTHLQFRHAPQGAIGGMETLAEIPIQAVADKWVMVDIQLLNAPSGWVTCEMTCVESGQVLMAYKDPTRVLSLWRRAEVDYHTAAPHLTAFEGRPDQHNRFKWGLYRSANLVELGAAINDVHLYIGDITVYSSSPATAPSRNLAAQATISDVTENTQGNHPLQRYHNVPSRVVDQAKCPITTVATHAENLNDPNFPPFSWFSPAANTAANPYAAGSGALVLDFGQVKAFDTIITYTKTLMLAQVILSVPDTQGGWTVVGTGDNTPQNITDQDLTLAITLSSTVHSQLLKVEFVGGNVAPGGYGTENFPFQIGNLLRVSQIEVLSTAEE